MSKARVSNVSEDTSRMRANSASRAFSSRICGSIIVLLVGLGSCIKAPEFDIVPKIEFVGMSSDTMLQGIFRQDSLTITFHFEDGDGDLGREEGSVTNNVFLIDLRTGFLDQSFGIPFIPQQGSANGIEGMIHLRVYSTCCIYQTQDPCTPSVQFPYDAVQYEIYITDRAGHESNRIVTPVITLVCN